MQIYEKATCLLQPRPSRLMKSNQFHAVSWCLYLFTCTSKAWLLGWELNAHEISTISQLHPALESLLRGSEQNCCHNICEANLISKMPYFHIFLAFNLFFVGGLYWFTYQRWFIFTGPFSRLSLTIRVKLDVFVTMPSHVTVKGSDLKYGLLFPFSHISTYFHNYNRKLQNES